MIVTGWGGGSVVGRLCCGGEVVEWWGDGSVVGQWWG